MSYQYSRGENDRLQGKPAWYGPHFGMRSTLERDKAEYFKGWNDMDASLRYR